MRKRFISLLLVLAMLLSLGATAVASDDTSAAAPAEPTEAPAEPAEATEPTEEPVEPTEEPTEPTEEPAEEPVEPTEEPAEEPVEPTEAPAEPAAAAEVPDGAIKVTYQGPDVVINKYDYVDPGTSIWVFLPKEYEIKADGGTWDSQYPRCYNSYEYENYAMYQVKTDPDASELIITVEDALTAELSVDGPADKIKVVTKGPSLEDVVHDQFPLTLYPADYNDYNSNVRFRLDPAYKCVSGEGYTVYYSYMSEDGTYMEQSIGLHPETVSDGKITIKVEPYDTYNVELEAPEEGLIRLTDNRGKALETPGVIMEDMDPNSTTYIKYELKPGYKIVDGDNYSVSHDNDPTEDGWQSGFIYLRSDVVSGDTITIRVTTISEYTVELAGGCDEHVTLTVNGETKQPPFTVSEFDEIGYILDAGYVIEDGDWYWLSRDGEPAEDGRQTGHIILERYQLEDGAAVTIWVHKIASYTVKLAGGNDAHIKLTVNDEPQQPPFTVTENDRIGYILDEGYVIKDVDHVYYTWSDGEPTQPGKVTGRISLQNNYLSDGEEIEVIVNAARRYQVSVEGAADHITLYLDGVQQAVPFTMWEYQEITYLVDKGYVIDDGEHFYENRYSEQDVPDKTGGYIYIYSDTPSETSVVISVRERKQYQLNTIVSDGVDAGSVISLTADGEPLAPDGLFWEDAVVMCTLLDPNYTVDISLNQRLEYHFEERETDEAGHRTGRIYIEGDYSNNGMIDSGDGIINLYVSARKSIKVNIIDETNGASVWRITYDGEPLHEGVNEIFAEHNLEYELKKGFIFAANTECNWWEDEYGGHSDMRRGSLNVHDEDGDGVVTVTIRAIRDLILILPSSDILTVQYEGKTLSTGAAVPENARLQYRLAPHCTFEWGGQYTEFSTTGPDTEGPDGYTDGELMLSDYDGDGKVVIKATQASKYTLRLQGEADKLTLTVNGGELSDGSTIWGNQSLRFVLASGYVIDEMESEGGINYYSESSDGTTRGELYFYDSNGDGACTIVVRKLQTFAVQFNSDEIALYRGTTALASGDTASERDCLTYELKGKRVLKDSDEYLIEQFDGTGEPYLILQDENGDGTVKIETMDGVEVTVTGEYKAANITITTFGENGGSQPVPTSGGMTARGYEITVGVDAAYSIQVPGVEFDYAEYNWQEDDAVRRLRHWYNFTVPADSDGIVINVYADPDSVPTIYDVVYVDSDGHIDSWDKRMYSKALAGERFLLTVDAGYRLEAENAATRTEGGIDGNLNILVTVDRDLAPGKKITVHVVKDDGLKLVLQGAVGHAVFTRGQSVLATGDTVYEGEQVRAVPDSGYVVTAMGMYPHTDWGYNEKITWIQIQDSNHDGEVHLRVEEGAVLSIAGDLDGVEPYAIRSLDGATFAVGDSVSITLKPGYELAGQECNNYANDEDGKLMRDYYITVEKTGPMTLTIQKETQALKSIPVNCNGPEGAFITKPEEAMPGSWFSVALSQGYYATAEGAELSLQGYTESMFAGAVLPDATSVKITAQKAAWRAKLRVTSGKDQVVAYNDYFVSSLDGDTLPYGIGTVAVKNGYELKAEDGAIVGGGMIIQEGKEIYRVYTVIATEAECKVAVTASAATAGLMAVTIDNEAKADYDLPSAYYEDGTYYVIAYDSSVAASYRIQLEEGYGVKSGGGYTAEVGGNGYWYILQQADAVTLNIVKISPEVSAKVADAVENEQTAQSQLENTLDSIISSVASGDGETNGLGADAQAKIQDAIKQAEGALDGEVTLPTVAANLSVEKKEETAVAADAAKIEQAVGQAASVKQYLDISIAVTVNGQPAGNLTETDDVITFKVPVAGLDKDKDYSVARVHDGTVTMLKAWVEGDSLCFQSDKFSTYAVVSDYKVIDVNRDKLFSKADAVALFRFVSRGIYENVDVKEGDVVEDNGITLKDVTKLYQMANGK